MEQETRPYIKHYWPDLEELADRNWSDSNILQEILSELKYRKAPGAVSLRRKVTERLVYLSQNSFHWPSTAILPASEALENDNFWYESGLLSFLGYKVGQDGVEPPERQVILDYVYNENIPNVNSLSYMEEWGVSKSSLRLKKMAESLASFARNAKRRNNADMDKAIKEWEDDLDYLKPKYYDGIYDFSWPITSIQL